MSDRLFSFVEELQGSVPWGSILDAGTGEHSLAWIAKLPSARWTAVTGDERTAEKLRTQFASRLRAGDRIVAGNWNDPLFLHGEAHDVVVADYLLGAIDGFAPYFQDRLFVRLRPLVGQRLYVIGLEPFPDAAEHPWDAALIEIARLRDACILLAGHRPYREYPLEWTVRAIEESGFAIDEVKSFPIRFGPRFIDGQLDVCRSKLRHLRDAAFAAQLERVIEELRRRALALHAVHRGRTFSEDYVIAARPA